MARAVLAGEPGVEPIVARWTHMLGRPWRWLRPLAKRYVKEFAGAVRPLHHEVADFLYHDDAFQRAFRRHYKQLRVLHWLTDSDQMQPVAAAAHWNLPAIETTADLEAWLSLPDGDIPWFTTLDPKVRHYHYRLVGKASRSVRLIEAPKTRLKAVQTRILTGILNNIPLHPAVHGFAKGRSIKTFVAPHVAQRVVLRLDLNDFFPSISATRIRAFFRTLGYPETVAGLLATLCTTMASKEILDYPLYNQPHLPQGAPTSPTIANLCAYRLDCRLAGLAKAAGAVYTRYADDLAFSGPQEFARHAERFSLHAAAIAMNEGFRVHHRKTRIMRTGVRQHLAGLSINQHANIIRPDFDRLKATLTNCLRHGSAGQNHDDHPDFRAHLLGKVAFVEMINPARAQKLRRLFRQIRW